MKDTHQRHTYSTSIELRLFFHTEYKNEHKKKAKSTKKIITTTYTNFWHIYKEYTPMMQKDHQQAPPSQPPHEHPNNRAVIHEERNGERK